MTKRLTDCGIWQKDWFLELSIKQKLLVKFLFDNCDCAGVYEISFRQLEFIFGEKITKEDFDGIRQIKFIAENKIFIEDFIEFHYKVNSFDELNPSYSLHKGVLKSLEKNKIYSPSKEPLGNPYLTLNQPLPNPCLRVQEQYKDKEEEKNTSSLKGGVGENFLLKPEGKKAIETVLNEEYGNGSADYTCFNST